MALTYDGANGLFTRLGKLFGLAEAVRTHQTDVKTRIAGIQTEYSAADSFMIGALVGAMEARVNAAGSILSEIQIAARTTLIETCYADSLVSTRSVMPDKTLRDALLYLIREMYLDSESVEVSAITKASVGTGTGNTGNGTLIFTELPPLSLYAGVTQFPNIRTEYLEIRCVRDATGKELPSGSELFEIRGAVAQPNLDYRFPAGSGARFNQPCLNPALETGARYEQLLRNGSFSLFTTANIPDGFTVSTGTAGTHFAQETTTTFRGGSAFSFIGNGSTLAKIRQQLNSDTGTFNTIQSDRLYVLAIAARTTGTASAGVVRFSLQDASGTVVTGATQNISYSVGTSFAWQYVFFRAPLALPSTIYAVLEQTTALNSGCTMILDELVLAEVRQFAAGSQGIVILSGSTDWVVNDHLRLKSTNDLAGEFNTEFDRFYDMFAHGLMLPANATATIADALIS
jgi:hypothetical protein